MILGVHTPETKSERDVDRVQKKAIESDLHFPTVIDNGKRTWKAWGNGWWPTVYLVDKQGYVRYWWAGELDWKGTGGQKVVDGHIRTLLGEAR